VITGARGLRGQVRVKLFSRDASSLTSLDRVFLQREDGEAVEHQILATGLGGRGQLSLTLSGCRDREQAAALVGWRLMAHRDDLPPLAPEEFYLADTVGCAVVSVDGASLGEVVSVGDNGAHGLLYVRGGQGEMSIPAREPFVVGFDGEQVMVELPEGYVEALCSPVEGER